MYAARGSDVTTVIVNGRVVVRDREILTVDEEEVMERARAFGERVREVMESVAKGRVGDERGLIPGSPRRGAGGRGWPEVRNVNSD